MLHLQLHNTLKHKNQEVQIQIDPKLAAAKMRNGFCARGTSLKWHFRVLRDMQHLTCQSNQGHVRNAHEVNMGSRLHAIMQPAIFCRPI